MLQLSDLVALILLCIVLYHLWASVGVREHCLIAVKRHLAAHQLQLLDENIALRALWWKRNRRGQIHVWRRYHFEFSAQGDERYQGRIITLGKHIENIELQAHRLPDERLH
ncbi:DUF3301 domain-containing protein [Spongiibacter sp. UBA1325]|uniref:DUF3301 domain-containing protein n=1 Tax=Spongiibacter sp. UBA1325 TaxID=1947543 RepID=UPI0025802D73|nr:DUF3301 domain-containing protein [Spongiibacter sp. UBA1325]